MLGQETVKHSRNLRFLQKNMSIIARTVGEA